jgi:hypothetical protein
MGPGMDKSITLQEGVPIRRVDRSPRLIEREKAERSRALGRSRLGVPAPGSLSGKKEPGYALHVACKERGTSPLSLSYLQCMKKPADPIG